MLPARVADRYNAAATCTIEGHELAWPSFRQAPVAVRELHRIAYAEGCSTTMEQLLEDVATWTRALTGSPLRPGHLALGTHGLHSAIGTITASGHESRFHELLSRLADTLARLLDEPHPAGLVLEDVISRYGAPSSEGSRAPAVYLAARHEDVQLCRRWVGEEELDVEVCSVSGLRSADVRDALILLGPPARYVRSPWRPRSEDARVAGWLLTAPPARHVHVLTWPGHPRLEPTASPLLPGAPAPSITIRARGAAAAATGPLPASWPTEAVDVQALWASESAPDTGGEAERLARRGSAELVPAIGVRLAGGDVAFFAPEQEPFPVRATYDLGAVHVAPIDPSSLRPGMTLLFRPARAGLDGELRDRADAILANRFGSDVPARAAAAKAELKEALRARREARSTDALVTRLGRLLDDPEYARHILISLWHAAYIAPQRKPAYDALRTTLDLAPDESGAQWRLLCSLRTALRQAGMALNEDLVDALTETTSWQEDLETTGAASIGSGPLTGHLELRVVTAADARPHNIPRTGLGRLSHYLSEARVGAA